MNMKTISTKAWVIPGILATALLSACGGGGGGPVPAASVPSLTITAVNAVTASVKINNTTGAALEEVQVLVSTLKTLSGDDATSEDAETQIPDVLLFNSNEDVSVSPNVANNDSHTFDLKNVNFAAASSSTNVSASATCIGINDKALGTVRIEVFSQGSQQLTSDVPVCALQGKTYTVNLSV
jgi:hypothetical protein